MMLGLSLVEKTPMVVLVAMDVAQVKYSNIESKGIALLHLASGQQTNADNFEQKGSLIKNSKAGRVCSPSLLF